MKITVLALLSLCLLALPATMCADDGPKDDGEARALKAIEKAKGAVFRDEKAPGKPVVGVSFHSTGLTDKDLKGVAGALAALKNLKTLDLINTKVTDDGLKELARLKGLQGLHLGGTEVTDAGLKHLKSLKALRQLDLSTTKVSDNGVKELTDLKTLRWLLLLGSGVTDKGFEQLKRALPDCEVLGN
jgi:Leucine-rich repeat (LRR) protein